MIDFKFIPEGSRLFCNFSGRMDSPTAMEIEKTVLAKLEEFSKGETPGKLDIVFDLKSVDYIASAFMKICLRAAKSTESGKFSVVNTNPFVMKIFKMAGLDKELNVS